MSDSTAISWARHTLNLWWGCDEPGADPGTDFTKSADRAPECMNCYARAWDHRMGGNHWGPGSRKFASDSYLAKALKWNTAAERAGVRASVFCQSMGDWAELHPDPAINAQMDVYRGRMWELIKATPWLDWLLLTKRVDRLAELLPWMGRPAVWRELGLSEERIAECQRPWPNVWPGTSCGARSSLWRVERLRQVPAVRRFVSAEPLTEHITAEDWDRVLGADGVPRPVMLRERQPIVEQLAKHEQGSKVHWLIVGDESAAPKDCRPVQPDWIRTAREAAIRHGVRFHLKQLHVNGKKVHLPVFDGRVWDQVPSPVDLSS